jgi:DNA-binding SARP family transcriptional activator
LHVLRSELGDEAVRRRGDSDVAIDETLISCDVVAFELAVEAGDYERALELYRGDLLEGLFVREAPEFERWLDDERTRLREMAAGAAWALAHQHIGAGRLVGAERTAQRALLLVATDESEVRRFIQALAHAGDRAAAVRFYEKFAQRLRSEYEIEPDPSTVAVSQALVNAAAHPHQVDKTTGEAIAAEQLRPVAPSDSTTPTDARPSENAFMRSRKVQIGVAVATVATLVLAAALLLPRWSGRTLFPDRVIVVAILKRWARPKWRLGRGTFWVSRTRTEPERSSPAATTQRAIRSSSWPGSPMPATAGSWTWSGPWSARSVPHASWSLPSGSR